MQQPGEHPEDFPLPADGNTDGAERLLRNLELFGIVDSVDGRGSRTTARKVRECRIGLIQAVFLAFLCRGACEKLIEDVVVSLGFGLVNETGTLEEVCADPGSNDLVFEVEQDLADILSDGINRAMQVTHLDVLSESRRVIIPRRLCIPKRLHDWIARQDLPLRLAHPVISGTRYSASIRCN